MKKYSDKLRADWYVPVLFILLFYLCFAGWRNSNSPKKFDTFSNNAMIADLICNRAFGKAEFIQSFGDFYQMVYEEKYLNDEFPQRQETWLYQSQVGIHSYLYYWLDQIPLVPGKIKLQIFYAFNAAMLALILTGIIVWFRKYTGNFTAILLGIFLTFCSPSLTNYGTNLYWVGWTLFLPMAVSMFVVEHASDLGKSGKRIFLAALLTGVIKNFCYFEFTTAVMVSTVIPYIFVIIVRKIELRSACKIFCSVSAGALGSLVLTFIYKLFLLYKVLGSWGDAAHAFLEPILMRVTGTMTPDYFSEGIMASKQASTGEVILSYLKARNVTVGNHSVSNALLLSAISAGILFSIVLFILLREDGQRRLIAGLACCTVLAVAGPFSWLILATPHAYIHTAQCAVLWYLPFYIFGAAMGIYDLKCIFSFCSSFLLKKKAGRNAA